MILSHGPVIEKFEIPDEWRYRGEGNCNVVLCLPKTRKILRIRKSDKPKSIIGWIFVLISDFLFWYCGIGFKDELRDVNFYSNIMRPLFGQFYTSPANQVVLTPKQIKILNYELRKVRPEYRHHKTLQYGRAAIFDDFAVLPMEKFHNLHAEFESETFSVEIKPKQGWRPREEREHPKCLFCMQQYLKLEKRQIQQVTGYCPEDLFSGDQSRMVKALKHLFEAPQNNFRIFKNGFLVYGNNMDSRNVLREIFENNLTSFDTLLDEFCVFLYACLTADFSENVENGCPICVGRVNRDVTSPLPKGCVLDKILSVQLLDVEGNRSTYETYSKLSNLDEWSFVEKLSEERKRKGGCVKCLIEHNKHGDFVFVPYLLSAIAKDCSLMITFKKLARYSSHGSVKHVFRTKYGEFLVNIGVFDLYPKPLSTIAKHYRRNIEIVQAFGRAQKVN
ncbi:inositol-pentakisphosphate 2-kinase [Cylas formicarius]|uniref:inositol-pentakisphosphate 2-kinase n=1 Tax=Cylas formicarius TaxID=197179 RepID=UPI0029584B95|nr:inositol-pentakisphosphate 2-kinase [Cylas formicarius]